MNSYPTDSKTNFILCEDFRKEAGGKTTLLGAFLGNGIIVHEDKKENLALPSLAFIFVFNDGSGNFQSKVNVISPGHKPLIEDVQSIKTDIKSGASMVVIFKVAPFPVEEGTYKVEVLLDDRQYEREFYVKFGVVPMQG